MEFSLWLSWTAGIIVLVTLGLTEGCDIGTVNPSSHTATLGTQTDKAFFLAGYASSCCGSLDNWKYHATATGTIKAQLWRLESGVNYRLIAEETINIAVVGFSSMSPAGLVEVEVNDIVGWDTVGTEVIPHSTGTGLPDVQSNDIGVVPVNNTASWGNTADTTKAYAFGAVVNPNELPVVTDTDVTFPDTTPGGTTVSTVAVTDADTADVTTLDVTLQAHASFTLDPATLNINTVGTVPVGVYKLEVVATDRCGAADTGTATITITGVGPVLVGLDTTYGGSVSDSVDTDTSIYRFSVIDSDPVSCLTTHTEFTVDPAPAPDFDISVANGADLNFDLSPVEEVVVECNDGSLTSTGTLTVAITDEPPTGPTGLPDTTTIDDGQPPGTSLHTYTVPDSDDTITCTIDPPENALFAIVATPPNYEIQTSAALNYDDATSHTLVIECAEDDATPATVTGTFTVSLTDKAPDLTNLPGTATISDGSQTATSLWAFTCTDPNDQANPLSISVTDNTRFEIQGQPGPDLELWTIDGQVINSAEDPITLTITCGDGNTDVTGTAVISVGNNGPVFDSGIPGISDPLSDDTVTAVSIGSFFVTDQDTVTCSITDPATHPYEIKAIAATDPQEFQVWTIAGVTEDDIDYDDNAATNGDIDLTIVCNDGTANPDISGIFTVNITDATPTLVGLPATYTDLSDGTTAELVLGTFTLDDSDDLAIASCDIDPTYTVTDNFDVRAAAATTKPQVFEIFVKANPTGFDADTTPSYTLPIECTDGTNPAVTGTYTVTMINAPLTFDALPATSTHPDEISDGLETDTKILDFSVTDNNAVTCDATAPAPYDDDFFIVDNDPNFELWIDGLNEFHFDDDETITITISCTDGTSTITADYVIELYDEPPVVAGLPGTDIEDLSDTTAEMLLDTFTCTDSDDTCTCGIDPTNTDATDSFEVRNGATDEDFEIWVKGSHNLDASVIPSYNFSIECTDDETTVTNYKVVAVQNTPPVYTNMPFTYVSIPESVATETTVHTVKADDTTDLYCYLTNPVDAPGVLIRKKAAGPPTTEYDIIVQENPQWQCDTSNSYSAAVTCEDDQTSITDVVTIDCINSAPVIKNPTASYTLKEYDAEEKALHDIELEDFDKEATCVLTNNHGGLFELTDYEIRYTASPPPPLVGGPYAVDYECTDAAGETATGTVTVSVENEGPRITNAFEVYEIMEGEDVPKFLDMFTTSETVNTCYQTTAETDVIVKLEPTTNVWGLYFEGGPLDYDTTQTITIKAKCEDDDTAGPEKTFLIRVKKNEAPTFTNIDFEGKPITTIEVEAKNTMQDQQIFLVETDDAEGDEVFYNITSCDPSTLADCPFEILPTGSIQAKKNLDTHTERRHTLDIQINDKYNDPTTKKLIVKVKDPNTEPQIRSLPKFIGVKEDRAVGDVVYTVTRDYDYTDPDAADDTTVSCEFLDGGEYFACNEDGEVIIIKELDFETQNNEYHMIVTINDGYEDSVAKEVKIRVHDVNEVPEFDKDSYSLTHDEGGKGETVGCPGHEIIDPDGSEDHTIVLDCPDGDGVFHWDPAQKCIKMTREWDLDRSGKRRASETITCTGTVFDKDEETDTAEFVITINEKDDEKPWLDKTQYSHCAPEGSSLSSFAASAIDNDVLARHKDLEYELLPSSLAGVDSDGTVTVGDVSGYSSTSTFSRHILRVSDDAGNYDESPVDIFICPTRPVVSNTNTNTNNNAAATSTAVSSNDMLYWLIPALFLLALMLGLLGFLCWRCWRNGKCGACRRGPKQPKITRVQQTPPKRPPTPPTPPTPPRRPVGQLHLVEMPMTHFWGRNVGNIGYVSKVPTVTRVATVPTVATIP